MDEMCGIQIDINKAIFKKREKCKQARGRQCTPMLPAFWKLSQGDCKFEASLG
jgi:hypothetical protein